MSSATEFELHVSSTRMDDHRKKRLSFDRRFVYFMICIFIATPVMTGILVWYLAPRQDNDVTRPSVIEVFGATDKPTTPGPIPGKPWTYFRLPDHIVPRHYDIILYPNFYENNSDWFNGSETVEIEILKETHYILIHHSTQMEITATRITHNDTGRDIEIGAIFEYSELWVVETKLAIPENSIVKLHLTFHSPLKKFGFHGFCKSTYVNSITKETRSFVWTMLEPTFARAAFPCFDEPNMKAEFTVTLVHRPGYTALSNMPEERSTIRPDGLLATRFQRSVPMSTYLVCFVVCDFVQLNTTTKTDVLVRVWAPSDRIDRAQYALGIANSTLDLFEELFNQSYPLPKLDMIAIPNNVWRGAMENWGLITYREPYMLFDPKEVSSKQKWTVAVFIAHELAHQWFGNLVTMDWWDGLWLKEGVASLLGFVGVADFQPEWKMMSQFVVDHLQTTMLIDSVVDSKPMVVPVAQRTDVYTVFDATEILYWKGASVILMLEHFMGEEKFWKGIQIYLKQFEFRTVRMDDLWRALSEVDGALDFGTIMETWTLQMGYPYINITVQVNEGRTTVNAYQERFLLDPNADATDSEYVSPYGYKWYVPLDYITSADSSRRREWMNLTDVSFDLPLDVTAQNNWVKFNVNQTGFYRVNYPVTLWRKLAADLEAHGTDILSPLDRAGLVDDAFSLTRAGLLSYDVSLDVTKYLHLERDYFPWNRATEPINYITSMFESSDSFALWRRYMLSRAKPVLDYLGWDDTGSHVDKLMRCKLIALVCGFGDEECLSNATSRFKAWMDSGTRVPPNLRPFVYRFGIQASSSADEWEFMWDRYKTVEEEKDELLHGMARTRQIWLIYRFLGYAMDGKMMGYYDLFSVITYLSQNLNARDHVWRWARENWERLGERFSLGSRSLGRMIPEIISNFNTEFQLQEVKDFFAKYPDAGAGAHGRIRALKRVQSNIAWMKMNENTITEWLHKRTID